LKPRWPGIEVNCTMISVAQRLRTSENPMPPDVRTPPIRVMIVDDDPHVLDGVELVIKATPGFECVGRLATADGLVEGIVRAQPDIVLLDLDMPGRNVIETIVEVCRYRRQPVRIIMLSGTDERWAVETALAVGARGYVVKLDGIEAIRHAIHEVMEGKVSLSPTAATLVRSSPISYN
jgi:DNA-binding NarL/FixJ family response regulator